VRFLVFRTGQKERKRWGRGGLKGRKAEKTASTPHMLSSIGEERRIRIIKFPPSHYGLV